MRRFTIRVGSVEGIEFTDGTVAVRWGNSTAAYGDIEALEEDLSDRLPGPVTWIDRADVAIGYVATEDAPMLRCLKHPFQLRRHRHLMESELKGEEPFLCSSCGQRLEAVYLDRREYVEVFPLPADPIKAQPGVDEYGHRDPCPTGCAAPSCGPAEKSPETPGKRKGLDSLERHRKLLDSLDSLVIGYQAERADGLVTLFRCLSDPFIVTAAKWVTRTDLPNGGVCGKCGVDLLAFLDEPARLCTLDRWEQARTAEPPEYREHAAGCSKLYYHPDACWPVEG